MRLRMGRVLHPDAWSQRPLWATNHVVSNVIIENESPNGDVIARSRFHMMAPRRRAPLRRLLHASAEENTQGDRIKLQRVEMTNEFRQIYLYACPR